MPAHATISAACYSTNMNNVSLTTSSLSGAGHYAGQGKGLKVVNGPPKVKASDFAISGRYKATPVSIPTIVIQSAPNDPPPVEALPLNGTMLSAPLPQRQGSTVASRLRNTPRQAAVAGTARRIEAEAVVAVQEEEDGQATPTPSSTQGRTVPSGAKTPEELENALYGTPPPLSLDNIPAEDAGPPAESLNTVNHRNLTRTEFLANSGVDTWTDYPLSTSPRPSMAEARHMLDQLRGKGSRNYPLDIGAAFPKPQWACHRDVRISKINDGHGFADVNYQAVEQPRSMRAHDEDGEDVAPDAMPVGTQMSKNEREEAEQAAEARRPDGPPRSRASRLSEVRGWSGESI